VTTRNKLKALARDVVQDKGVRALTLRDLGEAAGIKSSSVAYHFGSKEALLREITSDYIAEILVALEEAERTIASGRERMLTIFEHFEGLGRASHLCLCGVMAGSLHEVGEETGLLVRKFFEVWFTRQIQEESLLGKRDAKTRARALVAAAQGAVLLDKADGGMTHLASVRKSLDALMGA